MSVAGPLKGIHLKLDRALRHMKEIEGTIAAGPEGHGDRVVVEPDPDASDEFGQLLRIRLAPNEAFIWAAMIGDCIHNLRSALDHLAYQLALAESGEPLSDDIERSSEFPIFDNAKKFSARNKAGIPVRSSGLHKIRGINPSAQTEIENLQPYKGGDQEKLWTLQELSIIEKHRIMLLGDLTVMGLGVNPRGKRPDGKVSFRINYMREITDAPLEDGTVLTRFSFEPFPPDTELDLEFGPTLQIAFKRPPAERQLVIPTLLDIREYIGQTVIPAVERFL